MKFNIQLFGGRGSSSGGSKAGGAGGGRFSSESEFESSLTGFDDPRLQEYTTARESALSDYGLDGNAVSNLTDQARRGELGEWARQGLAGDRRQAQEALNAMPANKTPTQLGEASGLTEVVNSIDNILSISPTENPRNPYDVSIVN